MIVDDMHYNDEQNQAIKEASQDCILLLILLNMRHFPAKPIHFVKNPSFIHILMHRITMNIECQSPCAVEACIFAEALHLCPPGQYPLFMSQVFMEINTNSLKVFSTFLSYISLVQSVDDKIALLLVLSNLLAFLPSGLVPCYQKRICHVVFQILMDASLCLESEMPFCFDKTIIHPSIPTTVSHLLAFVCDPVMYLHLGIAKVRRDLISSPLSLPSWLHWTPSVSIPGSKKCRRVSLRPLIPKNLTRSCTPEQPTITSILQAATLSQLDVPSSSIKRTIPTTPLESSKRLRTDLLDLMIESTKELIEINASVSASPFVSPFPFLNDDTLPIFIGLCVELTLKYSRRYPDMVWCIVAIRLLCDNNTPWMIEKMKEDPYVMDVMKRLTDVLFRLLGCCKRNIHNLSRNEQLTQDMMIYIGKWITFVNSKFSDTQLGQEMALLKVNLLTVCKIHRMNSGISSAVEI